MLLNLERTFTREIQPDLLNAVNLFLDVFGYIAPADGRSTESKGVMFFCWPGSVQSFKELAQLLMIYRRREGFCGDKAPRRSKSEGFIVNMLRACCREVIFRIVSS